ncbi:MAG: sugar nucleotide-binding protein [Candidatus Nanohaloarchaea archaeon]
MSRQVIVLGATGFIGRALATELEKRGYSVIRASRTGKDVSVDLTDIDQVMELPDADAVVNAAGLGKVDGLEGGRNRWDKVNVSGVENLGRRYGDTFFVHVSSLAAKGLAGDYSGESTEPELPYSKSKRASEVAVEENFSSYAIVRPGFVYDEGEVPGLLRFAARFGVLPASSARTPAVHRQELVERIGEMVDAREEGVYDVGEGIRPAELARRAGYSGIEVPVPGPAVLLLGTFGELLRRLGFAVPGKVRARSILSDQDLVR